MVPALPSTVTSCPGCRRIVASPVATTWDSVFAGHQGGVRSEAAAVGDAGCSSEQRRPCRSGSFRDKHIAVAEPAEVLWALHEAYRSGCAGVKRLAAVDEEHTASGAITAARLLTVDDALAQLPACLR